MNLPQRIILALGTIVVAGVVLFPPWLYIYTEPASQGSALDRFSSGHGEQRIERPAGYHFLFGQPIPPSDVKQLGAIFGMGPVPPMLVIMQIDLRQLGVQFGGALAVTMLLVVMLKSRK